MEKNSFGSGDGSGKLIFSFSVYGIGYGQGSGNGGGNLLNEGCGHGDGLYEVGDSGYAESERFFNNIYNEKVYIRF